MKLQTLRLQHLIPRLLLLLAVPLGTYPADRPMTLKTSVLLGSNGLIRLGISVVSDGLGAGFDFREFRAMAAYLLQTPVPVVDRIVLNIPDQLLGHFLMGDRPEASFKPIFAHQPS